jgi:hypothetical protein
MLPSMLLPSMLSMLPSMLSMLPSMLLPPMLLPMLLPPMLLPMLLPPMLLPMLLPSGGRVRTSRATSQSCRNADSRQPADRR